MPQVRAAARPTTLGHYTLIERIGTGGQGEVWKAHDESRGVDVALKILAPAAARHPAAWEMLEREHALSSRLQHPGILQVLPPERFGEVMALPMELAAGGDLRRLRGAGYLEIVPALLEAAEALEYAHARGVVHRDLKPGNVLLDSRGRVKLADFGIAALLPAAGAAGAEPRGGGHSPFTASPEQLRGEPASAADDIYGLGALAYELLSGHPPYYPNFDPRRAQTQPVPELVPTRQIPPELAELIMRMLAKRAADRPATMQQVMDELDATLNATLSFAPEGIESDVAPAAEPSPPLAAARPAAPPRPPAPAATFKPLLAARPESRPQQPEQTHGTTEAAERGTPHASRVSPAAAPADAPGRQQREDRGATSRSGAPRVVTHAASAAPEPSATSPAALPDPVSPRPRVMAPVPPVRSAPPPVAPPHPEPASRAAAPVEEAGPDDPLVWGMAEPRLRAPPRPDRRQARAGAGRTRHWPYLVSGLLCGAVLICAVTAAALFWLPREDLAGVRALLSGIASAASTPGAHRAASPTASPTAAPPRAAPPPKPQPDPGAVAQLDSARASFRKQAAALQSNGAASWDAADFAAAQMQAAEANGAAAAGGIALALRHMTQAQQLLADVATKAPHALAAELKAGNAALAAGNQAVATQAFALARRIDPGSQAAIEGARRARLLSGVLPLLADARKAEAARDYSRAAQDYSQALALDPGNTAAKTGLARVNAAFGDDSYARAVGAGFAALGAGRLTEAQTDFQQALGFRPQGAEAEAGLRRVGAALQASRIATLRQRAMSLEAQEHWGRAAAAYASLLRENPALAFAARGEKRAEARAHLSMSLQQIIDHPHQLALPSVRDQAVALLQEARGVTPAGPVLQSQVERIDRLMPQLDRPVPLTLLSDGATQVSIPTIGELGAFGKREIRLKPGTYTVVGTRDGYRAVHQEFTVEPGQQSVTITVSCSQVG